MSTEDASRTTSISGRTALLAAVVTGALVFLGASTDGLSAQQQGRQEALDAQEMSELRSRIQEVDNRVLIGFKPAGAKEGMRADGTPRMTRTEVRSVARRFEPGAIRSVDRQYGIIPAIAARIAPDRLRELVESPRVDYVEPDYLNRPTDSRVGSSIDDGISPSGGSSAAPRSRADRGAARAAQVRPWGIRRIEAPSAWSVTRGSGVDVGIIDTGVDEDHPDLDPVSGINTVTGGTARSDWDDASPSCGSHGTHVAGTVAALDNSTGVVGVAPEAGLHAIRVFDPGAAGLTRCLAFVSDVIAGIEWSVDNGMDVINMSLGSSRPSFARADALEAAYAAGVLPIASAGNDADRVGYPAGQPDAVAVAAVDSTDAVASFSNHGPEIEVAGPGVSVLSTRNDGTTFRISGTSMASPHAAGVAALIRAAAPGLGLDDVRSVLRSRAEDLAPSGYDEETGDGLVRADLAAAAVGGGELTVTTSPTDVRLSAAPGGDPVTADVELRSSGGTGTVSWSVSDTPPWLEVSPASGTVSDGSPATLTVVADPAGLSADVRTGFVTIDGDAANAPIDLRTQFTLARQIPLDASVQTRDSLASADDRKRFVFSGTAGQRVDVAAVARNPGPGGGLSDPRLILYMPDGETPLARIDDVPSAAVGTGAVLANVQLPEDGDYVVEVSAGPDLLFTQAFPAGFTVLAREAGPILGFGPAGSTRFVRAREGGSAGETTFTVFNLSGVGSVDWSASSTEPWLSVSPGSGTASVSGESETVHAPAYEELRRRMWQGQTPSPDAVAAATRAELEWRRDKQIESLAERRGAVSGPSAATNLTLSADPSGFPPGDQRASVTFSTPADWLAPFQTQIVPFRVYDAGFEFLSAGIFWSEFATSSRDTAIGLEFSVEDATEIRRVGRDGSVSSPAVTLPSSAGGGFGFLGMVEQTGTGSWILGQNATGTPLLDVDPGTGTISTFANVPGTPLQVDDGFQGEIFAPGFGAERVFRVSPDGSSVTNLGSSIFQPWAVAFHPADSAVYVASQGADGLARIDLTDGSTTTVLDFFSLDPPGPASFVNPDNIAVARSGLLYLLDMSGRIWTIDPKSPSSSAKVVAFTPAPSSFADAVGLLDGQILMAGERRGGYLFPVNDGPARTSEPSGALTATVETSGLEGLRGDTLQVPLRLDAGGASSAPASYFAELQWNQEAMEFVDVTQGDFGGTFSTETGETGAGILRAEAERSDGLGSDAATLLEATFTVPGGTSPGSEIPLEAQFTELTDASGGDLLSELAVEDARLCVAANAWGDVDTDGSLGSGDAVQVLRAVVGLPLADGADPGLADVNRDGEVGSADAVHVLRSLVGLPVPEDSRVGRFGVSADACP